MDEMRISSKFMQNILSKLIKKVLSKNIGIEPDIQFESPIELKIDGETAQIHLNITANVSTSDITKLLKL